MRNIVKLGLALMAVSPVMANAQLVTGDLLSFQAFDSTTSTPTPVGTTVFFQDGSAPSPTSGFDGTISASGDQITFEYTGATVAVPACTSPCIEGALISVVDPALTITSATLDPATTAAGFSNSAIGLASGGAFIQYQGLTATQDTQVVLDITVSAVPEPSTYAMMLAGLGLIGFSLRRRGAFTRGSAIRST